MTRDPLSGIELLERQLWGTAIDHGLARVIAGGDSGPGGSSWSDEETYWALPSRARPRLIVPAEGRLAVSASLWNYRRLREPRERWARTLLGGLARSGAPLGRHPVRLQIRSDAADEARAALPLPTVVGALGQGPLLASIGVRPGANGKPTMQLIRPDGTPAGYAKLGWNGHTDDYVATETGALRDLDGGAPELGVPRLVASGSIGEHRWLVSAPLPIDVRALGPGSAIVSATELTSVCPVVRSAPVAQTDHWQRLVARAAAHDAAAAPSKALRRLVDAVTAQGAEVPVGQRWHGDLTPWNCARDASGRLWCWDWENAEDDAAAGLDAMHWAFSVRRRSTPADRISLGDCLSDASATLVDLAVPPPARRVLAATYAAVVADRAIGLAATASWERSWISAAQVIAIADQGLAQLAQNS